MELFAGGVRLYLHISRTKYIIESESWVVSMALIKIEHFEQQVGDSEHGRNVDKEDQKANLEKIVIMLTGGVAIGFDPGGFIEATISTIVARWVPGAPKVGRMLVGKRFVDIAGQ